LAFMTTQEVIAMTVFGGALLTVVLIAVLMFF
jgi:hypothetical protein